jgi:hypothetical protein
VSNNWDLLHGAVGVGIYYADRVTKSNIAAESVTRILAYLERKAEVHKEGQLKWISHDIIRERDVYNISLSHGISGIASFLLRASKIEFCQESATILLTGAINFILSQEIEPDKYGCYFPSYSLESDLSQGPSRWPSRLGWCYGDLGIASILYQSGIALHQQKWIDKALKIFDYAATQRKDVVKNWVNDAGLCHGSAGIGTIFYRMWWNTRLPDFKQAADHWFGISLQHGNVSGGVAGFKPFTNSGIVHTPDFYALLPGITGIGIAYISYHCKNEPFWDESLLISN